MSRGIGEVGFVSELPEWAVAIAGLVTQLGDMWFVLVGTVAVYWLSKRDTLRTKNPVGDSLFLFAIAIGGYALTVILKYTFALPRPPGAATANIPAWLPVFADPVYESMVTGDGFGFPSGHALKSTAVFGGAALVVEIGERQRQMIAAGLLILLVALSRVILGVHYLVDVVVGVAVGVIFLATMIRLARHQPRRALIYAGTLGLIAVAMSVTIKSGLVILAAIIGLAILEIADGTTVPTIS